MLFLPHYSELLVSLNFIPVSIPNNMLCGLPQSPSACLVRIILWKNINMLSSFASSGHQCFLNEAEAFIYQKEIKLLPQERTEKKPGNAQLLTVTIVIVSSKIACDQVFQERWNFKNSSSSYLLVRTKLEGCDVSLGWLGC